jgi:hypothetical protein
MHCVVKKYSEYFKIHFSGVRYIFCGHYHRNAGGFYKEIEQVITSAVGAPLGKDPSGFRLVQVSKDKITHEYISFYDTDELQSIIKGDINTTVIG